MGKIPDVGNWPQANKGVAVDRGQLKKIADALHQDYQRLIADSGPEALLVDNGSLTKDDVGDYNTAGKDPSVGLLKSSTDAYDNITQTLQTFLDTYKDVIDTLYTTAGVYSRADDSSTTSSGGNSPSNSKPNMV